jgi:hypothetical protein
MRLYLRSDDAVPNRLRITAGRNLPRRLPNVAGRRALERRGGANASLAGLHAGAFQLAVFGSAQASPWVRPCSPPSQRCRGGKITDSPPFTREVGYNGCGDEYAGAMAAPVCMSILMTPHCTFAQARTVVPAPRGTSRKASSAHPATKTRGTSCTNSRALLCSHAHSGILRFTPGWASCLSLSRCSWSAFSFALPTRCLLYSI